VLNLNGWEVGDELTARSKRGEWEEMAELIDDGMLETVAVVAPPEELASAIRERCDGIVDRLGLAFGSGDELSQDELASLVEALTP
jgi:hypothetical protein